MLRMTDIDDDDFEEGSGGITTSEMGSDAAWDKGPLCDTPHSEGLPPLPAPRNGHVTAT